MIARVWRGFAKPEKAEAYRHHFTDTVTPHLKELAGYIAGYLLRKDSGADVEFVALTLWDSLESIKAFTGENPQVAIVEPEARRSLSRFDEVATNYEVVFHAEK